MPPEKVIGGKIKKKRAVILKTSTTSTTPGSGRSAISNENASTTSLTPGSERSAISNENASTTSTTPGSGISAISNENASTTSTTPGSGSAISNENAWKMPPEKVIGGKIKKKRAVILKTSTTSTTPGSGRSAISNENASTTSLTPGSKRSAISNENVSTTSTTPGSGSAISNENVSTTSTTPGSGSAISNENGVDVDIERDLEALGDTNAGSDVDADTDFDDTSLRQRDVYEFPAEFDNSEDPDLVEAVQDIDKAADNALRALTHSEDYLHFDWREDIDNFEGVREEFIGPSGPTFDTTGLTPLGILKKIWDADIIAHIVRETNRYARLQLDSNTKAQSRLSRWKDTTEDEIWTFLGITMLQSLVIINVEREYWYPKLKELELAVFKDVMPFNRFCLLKRCLHFVDNCSLPEHPNKLHKIMPIIEHLNKKFSTLYLPEQCVAIDESLLLWSGRLSIVQCIRTKRAGIGIKSYELCESRTGYLWKMEIYTGKDHVHAPQETPQEAVEGPEVEDEPGSATSQIVFNLMRPLFNKGHTLVMDNFYNAPLLSRLLKAKYKTDTMGTLRLHREFVPEALKRKNKKDMNAGEICFSTTKDLSVVVWLDKALVAMLSTFHGIRVGRQEKHGALRYKPQVVLDYNLSMGGIDHKDQMLHAFPVERVRNMIWYKKLFRRLLNVSIHNALVIFTHNHNKIGNRDFRLQLAHEILQAHNPKFAPKQPQKPSEMHLPDKNAIAQRCSLCSAAKVRRTTVWRCSTCQVNLCMPNCYRAHHTLS